MDKAYPSPIKPQTLGTPAEPSFTTFNRALEEYLHNIPKDKKKLAFIQLCRDAGTNATPKDINLELQEKGALRARSGPAQKIFSKIMKVLMDYSEVIGQMGVYNLYYHESYSRLLVACSFCSAPSVCNNLGCT